VSQVVLDSPVKEEASNASLTVDFRNVAERAGFLPGPDGKLNLPTTQQTADALAAAAVAIVRQPGCRCISHAHADGGNCQSTPTCEIIRNVQTTPTPTAERQGVGLDGQPAFRLPVGNERGRLQDRMHSTRMMRSQSKGTETWHG
jgi:hypothetical protein